MNVRERVDAVLHGQGPDKIPFVIYDELLPRGEFERALRNRGLGVWTFNTALVRSERPHVSVETSENGNQQTTLYHTPVGTVCATHLSHLPRSVTPGRSVAHEGIIKTVEDYEPAIFMIDDEVYTADYDVYDWKVRDLGGDGYVRVASVRDAPYPLAYYDWFGAGTPEGLQSFVYAQQDHPDQFWQLVDAMERAHQRKLPLLLESPAEVFHLGSVDGCYGPGQFQEHVLPFYREWASRFHERGKMVYPHAHSSSLKGYMHLVPQVGWDMIDAFTPPPVGNLSLAEARAAWGDKVVIAVNFPETIFWQGAEATRKYTLDLLRNDPGGALIITMTEMSLSMVADDATERAFCDGMWAIMDAIDEYCG